MITLRPIGVVEALYKEKFGVPKQSQMNGLRSIIHIDRSIDMEAFNGLEQMSHLWVIFCFHLNPANSGAKVRPPVLGGNTKVGIYSSRSSFRHNNLGLSLVKLLHVHKQERQIVVEGLDCADETPVLDLKPFHPQADVPQGKIACGWIDQTAEARPMRVETELQLETTLWKNICEALKNDPRPQYHFDNERVYGITLGTVNVRWRVLAPDRIEVISVEEV